MREIEKKKDQGERARLMNDIKKQFLKVFKNGLTEDTLGEGPSEFGFDEAIKLLRSCCVLHELGVPEPEIKYQCSCSAFWHHYKCPHALAMRILKKGVCVPARERIENIGEVRCAGRIPHAAGGGALGAPAARGRGGARGAARGNRRRTRSAESAATGE